jgi:hypothetical protein
MSLIVALGITTVLSISVYAQPNQPTLISG